MHLTPVGPDGGYADIARVLLNAGADVNAAEANGRTTLHFAAMRNAYCVIDVLVEFGADLEAISNENDEQKTALMKAIDNAHCAVIDRLIDAGARLDVRDVHGTTPLIAAVYAGRKEVVVSLLCAGCDFNDTTTNGVTALEASLQVVPLVHGRHRSPHITEILVRAGCAVSDRVRMLINKSAMDPAQPLMIQIFPAAFAQLTDEIENPPSLQLCCRIVVRKVLGFRPADKINCLAGDSFVLPQRIRDFLLCIDLREIVWTYQALQRR